jgi:hypothetical protein
VGALSTPGTTVLVLTGVAHRPAPAASQRHVPAPRHSIHRCGVPLDEASTRVQVLHPSDLPLACDPRMEQEPLGFPPSFAPRDYSQRTSGRGQVIEHGPETTLYVIDLASSPASFYSNACDLASHATKGKSRRRHRAPWLPRACGGPSVFMRAMEARKRGRDPECPQTRPENLAERPLGNT